MNSDNNKITYFGETDSRNKKVKFGIKASDRTRHMYVIGKTGMGKSTLLENMAVQDIQNGEGMAFIDPHGGTAEKLLDYIPEHRLKDVIYFAPFDMENPVSFNIMEDVGADKRHLVANGLMNAFKKIWVDAWSARMEYILNNVLLALLEYPDATILGVNRMLSDKEYRNKVVENVTDSSVKSFWTDEFAKYGEKYMQEAGAAIQNKIGQFVSNPLIRNIIGQPKSSFDVRKLMDEKKILIMNLSKGRMGIENSALVGNMLVTKIYLGAMSRADAPEAVLKNLPNFYFYVDEFQSFANESFAEILSEARKYKLNLTIAHQYVAQMPDEVKDAVFGNVGTMITFRVGATDAEVFEKEFAPEFTAQDIVNLGFSQIYLRLMIDGIGSKPFSATTLPPISMPEKSFKERVIEETRKTYSTPRTQVEEYINKWYTPIEGSSSSSKKDTRPMNRSTNTPYQPRPKTEFVPPVATEITKISETKNFTKPEARENFNKDKDHQPFKNAFKADIKEDKTEDAKRVSLDDLRRKGEKPAPSKNSLDLKTALANALSGANKKEPEVKISEKETDVKPDQVVEKISPDVPKIFTLNNETEKDAEIKKESNNGETNSDTLKKEVPENILRNIFKE